MESVLAQLEQFAETHAVPMAYQLLAAIVTFVVGRFLATRISRALDAVLRKRVDPTIATFGANIANAALLAVVLIATLDRLGVETTSLIAIVGAAGLAIGLALKDSLGNFAAGVMLILFRPFRVGHYVEAGGTSGTVTEIRIFASILTTPDNKVITVPNGAIMAGTIVNYSEMPTRRVDMVIRVGYSSDLAKVKRIVGEVLTADARVLRDPEPTVAIGALADSAVEVLVRPWVNSADYFAVLWDTQETLKQRFDEEGIEIPFPQMSLHVSKPE